MSLSKWSSRVFNCAALLALLGSTSCRNGSDAGAATASSASGCEEWQFLAETSSNGGACFKHLAVTDTSAAGLQAFGNTNVTMAFFTSPNGSVDPRAPIKANTRVCANKRLVAPATLSTDYQARLASYIEGGKKEIETKGFWQAQINGWIPGFWDGIYVALGSVTASTIGPSDVSMTFSVSPMGLRNSNGSYEVWPAAFVPKHDCYLLLSSMKKPPYAPMIRTEKPLSY